MKLSIKIIRPLAGLCALSFSAFLSSCQAAPLTIAAQGKSTFSIVVPHLTAASVDAAAAEMQHDIAEATGAKLPIIKDDQAINGPFISLGSTRQAQAAKISAQDIPDEGFRIVTKGKNLYIIGLDTTAVDLNRQAGKVDDNTAHFKLHPEIPGPAFTKNGGFSQGTANGVYTFLEDYLSVRWLMPGDIGRDVPTKSTFTLDAIDRTIAPTFIYRVMNSLGRDDHSLHWRDHLKLGYSFNLHHNHNWQNIVPPSLWKEHPEWFAMNSNGQRPKPQGRSYKLETTNPELVNFVAQKAIKALKAQPELNTYSLSPTDGLGYSQSPESKALYDKGQITQYSGAPSVTPLILKFYSDVSTIVAKEYPQGKLAGYFYQQYRQPPSQGNVKIPENFVPVLVASGGSYGLLYNPDNRKRNIKNLNDWGKIAPSTWFYYCYPTWMRTNLAMLTPAAPSQLNVLFHDLAKNHMKGVFFYGTKDWSNAALKNYVAAKMLWDPTADATEIQREWLDRAYGTKAGAIMEELYNKMDESWFSDYYRQPNSPGSSISETFLQQVFGNHYPQMEKLVLEAGAQPMSEMQKARFELIADNMRVLQWRLRNAGYLPANYSSSYTIDTAQAFKLLSSNDDREGFVEFETGVGKNGSTVKSIDIKVQALPQTQKDTANIPNSHFILLYPTKDGTVHLKPTNVRPGSNFLYYWVHGKSRAPLARGILDNNEDITFNVKANVPYYLETKYTGVSVNPIVKWQISIPGAELVQAAFQDNTLFLPPAPGGNNRWLYVYAPESMDLTTESSDAGVTIQTLTTKQQKSQAQREARKAAESALAKALAQYQGSLIQNLDTGWKFTTDPDKKGVEEDFFKANFNDKSWKKINTLGPWQMHGFEDYHGTAWYRKTFSVSSSDYDLAQLHDKKLLLFVGAVDGDATFYLNGQKVAERKQYHNSWLDPFALDVTPLTIVGQNTLAVQVTKESKAAGLYKGVSLIVGVSAGENKDQ